MTGKNKYSIGVDIGGSNLKAVLLDENFKEVQVLDLATPRDNAEHFLIMLQALIDPLIKTARQEKCEIKGIGIGIPGLYDYKNNKIITLPNLSILNGLALAGRLEEKYGLPVKIDNDANCFVLAESRIGVGKKYDNIFGLTLGTDVGSGWWFEGKIYHGHHRSVNEITRMVIEAPRNLEELYQGIVKTDAEELAERAYRGDQEAQLAFENLGYYLGLACANVVNLLDPEAIVIGGRVTRSSDLFFPKIKKVVADLAMHPEARNIKILKAKVKGEVGAKGAALLFD